MERIYIYFLIGLLSVCSVLIVFLVTSVKNLRRETKTLASAYGEMARFTNELIDSRLRENGERADDRLRDMNTRLSALAVENEQKLEYIRQTVEKKLGALNEENSRMLEKMRITVDEKLQSTLEERISKSFQTVGERLEAVYKGLGEMRSLAIGVGDLKKVLSNVKTRGILGEVQLASILYQILSPEQFEENAQVAPDSTERVEFAVKLPGNDGIPVYLPIDSKFPGDRYASLREAYESGDKDIIEGSWKALEQIIKKSAKDIRDKYVKPPYTTDFGIMFLPFEGLYAEVVNHGMIEELQREYKINIAGPTTMAALLNSLQMGFRTLAIKKHSSEVWRILGEVKKEFGLFEKGLEDTRKRLRQADEELDRLVGARARAIERKLRAVEIDPDDVNRALSEERAVNGEDEKPELGDFDIMK